MDQADLEAELREVARKAEPRLFAGKPSNHPVFHYTSARGLHGIMGSGRLWMVADDETKDPLELRYASRLNQRVQDGFADEASHAPLDPFASWAGGQAVYGTYLTSFCEEGDVPHHWQNFAGGGRGFSIGIGLDEAAKWTTNAGSDKDQTLWIGPVIYNEERQLAALRAVQERARELDDDGIGVNGAVRQVLGEMLPFFKHPSYREEREWRIVAARIRGHTSQHARIEDRGDELVALLELSHKPPPLPVTDIVVGPRVAATAKSHVDALLARYVDANIESRLSQWGTWDDLP